MRMRRLGVFLDQEDMSLIVQEQFITYVLLVIKPMRGKKRIKKREGEQVLFYFLSLF
jgi:hypothetical protein